MDDAPLISRALGGDLDSFGQIYDRYFGGVYDFVWRVLRDNDAAAEVTQEVFTHARAELAAAAKAPSFKTWLFTAAHHSAIARAEHAGRPQTLPAAHEEAFGSFDVPDPARIDDAAVINGDHELAALVWEAATALNPRDYALLDLHVRRGLAAPELASVIGVSRGNAATMVSRMKTAASNVIASYVVARRSSNDCPGLQETLAPFDFPPYTDDVRAAVDAHIAGCDRCKSARAAIAAPLDVFAAFASVAAPMTLKGDVWSDVANAPAAAGALARPGARQPRSALPSNPYATPLPRGSAAAAAGGVGAGIAAGELAGGARPLLEGAGRGDFGGGGYDGGGADPTTGPNEGWNQKNILLFLGAAVGLLIIAFAGGAIIAGAFGGRGGSSGNGVTAGSPSPTVASKSATRTTTPGMTITPGVAVQTPTPNLTPPPTPVPADTPTEEPPTPVPPTVAPPTLPPPPTVPARTVTPVPPTIRPAATPTIAASTPIAATPTFTPP